MIGILALIGALAMLQSGQVEIGALTAKTETAQSAAKKSKTGKPPALIPREAPALVVEPVSAQSREVAIVRLQPRRELYQALARMDGEAAAEMLALMDEEQVTELLLQLRERDLARILEQAAPADAGRWVTDLLTAAPQLGLPEELASLAMDAAGEDALLELDTSAPVDPGTEDLAADANENAPEAGADESAQSADPTQVPGNNGAATEREFPSQPPDTNTA